MVHDEEKRVRDKIDQVCEQKQKQKKTIETIDF